VETKIEQEEITTHTIGTVVFGQMSPENLNAEKSVQQPRVCIIMQ